MSQRHSKPAGPEETPCESEQAGGHPAVKTPTYGGVPSNKPSFPATSPPEGPAKGVYPHAPRPSEDCDEYGNPLKPSRPASPQGSSPPNSPADEEDCDDEEGSQSKTHYSPGRPGNGSHPSAPAAYSAQQTPCESTDASKPYAPNPTPAGRNDTEPIVTGYYPNTLATTATPYGSANYSLPSNTYIPAQVTTNAGIRQGPTIVGLVGLAVVLAIL
jgi:hypothetical protein